jgi:general stress protein 26
MPVEPETTLGPFSSSDATATEWQVAYDALRHAQLFWLTTVRPDGRPHVVPLTATWALDGMCFITGDDERKAANLDANPHCVLTTGVNTLTGTDIVVEGIAAIITDEQDRHTAAAAFEDAYGWHFTRPDGHWYQLGDEIRAGNVRLYRVQPTVAFAFGKGHRFSQTRYRWT